MDRARKLLYSDFFAQLQSAQDLLAKRIGLCLVLVNREGQEVTLPSALPMKCNEHETPGVKCPPCHRELISQVTTTGDYVIGTCPNGLHLAAVDTSIRTDDGDLYLLVGRTVDRSYLENQIELIQAFYTLPFERHASGRRPSAAEAAVAAAPSAASAPAPLTQQENRVLACIVSGLSNKEIADQLCISPSTVKTHVVNILKKLRLSNRTEASVYALKNGIQLGDEP